jgi:hypothetical protein
MLPSWQFFIDYRRAAGSSVIAKSSLSPPLHHPQQCAAKRSNVGWLLDKFAGAQRQNARLLGFNL